MLQEGSCLAKSTYDLALSLNKAPEDEGSNKDDEAIFWKGMSNLKISEKQSTSFGV